MYSVKDWFMITKIFLDNYYSSTKSFDIGALLGDIRLLDDGTIADPASWNDWILSVNKVVKNKGESEISKEEAYGIMIDFLRDYGCRVNSPELSSVLPIMLANIEDKVGYWIDWCKSIEEYQDDTIV